MITSRDFLERFFLEVLCYNHFRFQFFLQEFLADNHYPKKFFCNKVIRTEQDKQFSVMQNFPHVGRSMYLSTMLFLNMSVLLSGNNSSSSLDLIILILLLGRFVLMKEIPGEHFLSHNSGKTLCTASCTESWRGLINEYAIFFIASRTFKFCFFISFADCFNDSDTSLSDFENYSKLSCKFYIVGL